MKNKKGSMELGINAIVVLIIALALLGLGIAFVTKLFSSSQSKMVRIIDRTELPIHADSLSPIVFDTSSLQIKAGKQEVLVVSVFNDDIEDSASTYIQHFSQCVDNLGAQAAARVTISSPSQPIPAGADAGFSVIVKPGTTEVKGTSFICTVGVILSTYNIPSRQISRQLFIEIV
jgi:hypothetical protein